MTHELKFDIQWNWTAFASVKAGFNFDLLKYNEILILSLISVSNFDEMMVVNFSSLPLVLLAKEPPECVLVSCFVDRQKIKTSTTKEDTMR